MRRYVTTLITAMMLSLTFIGSGDAAGKPKPKQTGNPNVVSAEKVMKNLRHLANVYEEGNHLVVEFKEYLFPYDINKRLNFVRTVADSDCVLKGEPRHIYFYNPGGKQMAEASPSSGIRLTE